MINTGMLIYFKNISLLLENKICGNIGVGKQYKGKTVI
jgi:hypothetical protein